MTLDHFKLIIDRLADDDRRYSREAYAFVSDAIATSAKRPNGHQKHVTAIELAKGVAEFAAEQFGPLADLVLAEWGIHSSRDLGNITFNMIQAELLKAGEDDRFEDFDQVPELTGMIHNRFAGLNSRTALKSGIIIA